MRIPILAAALATLFLSGCSTTVIFESDLEGAEVTTVAGQKYGVTPDIVCLAKAFGGGMPLGAFVSSREIMEGLSHHPALGHITTFGGHPVCCAAGLAALIGLTWLFL